MSLITKEWWQKNKTSIIMIGVLIIIILLLVWWLFSARKQVQEQKALYDIVKRERGLNASRAAIDSVNAIEYSRAYTQSMSRAAAIAHERDSLKTLYRSAVNKNISLADQVRAAKLLRDSARYIVACDSLVIENGILIARSDSLHARSDSLIALQDQTRKSDSARIIQQAEFISNMRASGLKVDSSFNVLYKAYGAQSKQLNREQTKTKIAAAGGVTAVILTLILTLVLK